MILTVALELKPAASVTVSLKASVRVREVVRGATNVASTVFAPDNLTEVPEICLHRYETIPWSSVDAAPVIFTLAPERTVRSGPAFATGGLLAGGVLD